MNNYLKRLTKANIGIMTSASTFGDFKVFELKIMEDRYSRAIIIGSSLEEVCSKAIHLLQTKYKLKI